jgi:hypothetical protein
MGAAAGPIDDADLSTDVLPTAGDGIVLDLSDVGPGAAESISSPAPEFTSGQVSSVSGPPVSSPIATELDHNLPEAGSLIPDALAIATDRTMLPPNGPLPGFDSNPGETLWTSEVRVLDDIPHARRSGMELARECGMSKRDAMRIGTVISDLARTVLEFSEGSELRISRVGGERNGLRITFSDLTDVVTDPCGRPLQRTATVTGWGWGSAPPASWWTTSPSRPTPPAAPSSRPSSTFDGACGATALAGSSASSGLSFAND